MFSGTFGHPRIGRSHPCGNPGVRWPPVSPRLAGPPLPALTPASPIHWDRSLTAPAPATGQARPCNSGPADLHLPAGVRVLCRTCLFSEVGELDLQHGGQGKSPRQPGRPEQLRSALHRADVPCSAQSASSCQPRGRLMLAWGPWARELPEGPQFLSLPLGSTHTDPPLNCSACWLPSHGKH